MSSVISFVTNLYLFNTSNMKKKSLSKTLHDTYKQGLTSPVSLTIDPQDTRRDEESKKNISSPTAAF